MRKNGILKVCAVFAFATCMSVGVATVNGAAETSTDMTCVGASTKIVSDLKDSGLAFKYSLNTELFANTAAGEVAFNEGVSAGVIVCPNELIPANFDVTDEETYGTTVQKCAIEAGYWGLNADGSAMEGIAYLYNIPDLDYDTEVTSYGYVTVNGETTYTEPTVRTMAYVAQAALADTTEDWTETQNATLNGFLTVKNYYNTSLQFKAMKKSDFATEVAKNSETAEEANKATISEADQAAIDSAFGDFVYASTSGVKSYSSTMLFTREYVDTIFADTTVEEFRFEMYCNNRVQDYRIAWGTAGTADLVTHKVGASGVFTVKITRSDYEAFVAEVDSSTSKDPNTTNGKFAFSLMLYVKDADGTLHSNNVYAVGNFRTYAWNLEELTIDFEDGKNTYDGNKPVFVKSLKENTDILGKLGVQSLTAIDGLKDEDGASDAKYGNYGFGSTVDGVGHMARLTISGAYLDDVFANANVTAISFDVFSNKTMQYISLYHSTSGWDSTGYTTIPDQCVEGSKSSTFKKGTCLISRAAYEALTTNDMLLYICGNTGSYKLNDADARIYFDNFTPILAA